MSITIYRLNDLEKIEEPTWLLEGIIFKETLAAIVGTRGTFKTFMALDWGLCVATGKAWQGRYAVPGNVLHIVGEGGRGIKRRAAAWRMYNGVALEEVENWACTIKAVDLLTETDGLANAVRGTYPDGKLALLIVDTLARNMTGDENNTAAMSSLVKQADAFRESFGTTVLFLHHTNRNGLIRGNSAFDGALDTIVTLQRKGDQVTVYNDPEHGGKQKDAEEFESFVLRRRRIYLGDEGDIGNSSIILELDDDADPHFDAVLRIMDGGGSRGMNREDVMLRCAELEICRSTTFSKVWKALQDTGRIEIAEDSPSRGRGAKWIRSIRGEVLV